MRRFAAFRLWILDVTMRQMNEMRPATVERAAGDVLEVGFGTGLNLRYYPEGVRSLVALDPLEPGLGRVERRVADAPFPVRRVTLRADTELPFGNGQFDCVVTTWTLCSIPRPLVALAEMRRVLKPDGRYLFVEHGRSDHPGTARWQDRLNPVWRRVADGCNMNRSIDGLVKDAGFQLAEIERFRARGPRILGEMYRGVASPAA